MHLHWRTLAGIMWGIIEGKRLGIVLFQLGGPDTLEAIEPFLYNLFCDPDIIDFPFARIGRKALAKLISTTRANKVRHHYAVIGEVRLSASSLSNRRARCSAACASAVWTRIASSPCATGDPSPLKRCSSQARGVRPPGPASSVSAIFLDHNWQQPERVEPSVRTQLREARGGEGVLS